MHTQVHTSTPQSTEEASQEYLQRYLEDDKGHCEEGRPANLTVHQVGEDSEMEGTDPQKVEEEEGEVEPLNIIGCQVDHMTCGHLP